MWCWDVGVIQQALADLIGVSRQTIIAIESGRYAPSLPLALRLAKAFDTTVEDIFELNDEEDQGGQPDAETR